MRDSWLSPKACMGCVILEIDELQRGVASKNSRMEAGVIPIAEVQVVHREVARVRGKEAVDERERRSNAQSGKQAGRKYSLTPREREHEDVRRKRRRVQRCAVVSMRPGKLGEMGSAALA